MWTNTRRYRSMLRGIRRERGERCEACGVPASHAHHVLPVAETGIAADLAYEPANLIILCDDCHLLMHPLIRKTSWLLIRKLRGRATNHG